MFATGPHAGLHANVLLYGRVSKNRFLVALHSTAHKMAADDLVSA